MLNLRLSLVIQALLSITLIHSLWIMNFFESEIFLFTISSTRKQKAKARLSREADFLLDIENMDVMLSSPNYDNFGHDIENEFEIRSRVPTEGSSEDNDIWSDNNSNGHT